MKVRIKFGKYGELKFIGHLDIMRYFQKMMRRADIDIKYSTGYSPHQIMSFAQPLGLGITSDGEYMDIEVDSTKPSKEMIDLLNTYNVDNIRIYSYRELPDNAKTGMAIIAAADYEVRFRYPEKISFDLKSDWPRFMEREHINVTKTTKSGESEVDLKPLIFDSHVMEDGLFLKLSCGSVVNLKPEVVLGEFYKFMGEELGEFDLLLHRKELYARGDDGELIALEDMGRDIE
ncbi:MAG: TIGR03936 family radical SAM-associated protein [Lachnospiraceae bacterium]|nr:TIGR03936 family radical SAM-associated protein [Lachnospiraceae bacterium]